MRAHNAKLPDVAVVHQLVEQGLTFGQIGRRYGVRGDTVRITLTKAGLHKAARRAPPVTGLRVRIADPVISPAQLLDDRTVCARRQTAMTGGSRYLKIPLPRISLHVDYLRDTGQCR